MRVHEVWKYIKGYEGLYKVSNQGRVKSIDRTLKCINKNGKEYDLPVKGKMLTIGTARSTTYLAVSLSKNDKCKRVSVHRLVAEAFIDNTKEKPFVNHIDANRHNNKASNLEWVTAKENTRHAQKLGNMPKSKPYWYDLY